MRNEKRIPVFLKLVDWDKLKKRWEIGTLILDKDYKTYWKNNPDQRIGQVLINLGLVYDTLSIWSDTEANILKDQGVAFREFLFWTACYDKHNELLDKPITKLIKDLDTDHIKNILKQEISKKLNLPEHYKETFLKELKIRIPSF